MSTDRCPLCSARLVESGDACPRCGADLSLPQAAKRQACRQIEQALARVAAGDRDSGAAHANRALVLHRTPLAAALADWLRLGGASKGANTHYGNTMPR